MCLVFKLTTRHTDAALGKLNLGRHTDRWKWNVGSRAQADSERKHCPE